MKLSEAVVSLSIQNAELLKRVERLEERLDSYIEETGEIELGPLPIPSLSDSSGEESQVGDGDDLEDLSAEERAAVLAARQRLANDTGTVLDQPDQGKRAVSDGTTVELPAVDPERAERRKQLAQDAGVFEEWGHEGVDAYVKGGPLWLYYGNRDFVLGLPRHIQQAMVADVEVDSKPEAAEMAHDLFKVRGAQTGGIPGWDS